MQLQGMGSVLVCGHRWLGCEQWLCLKRWPADSLFTLRYDPQPTDDDQMARNAFDMSDACKDKWRSGHSSRSTRLHVLRRRGCLPPFKTYGGTPKPPLAIAAVAWQGMAWCWWDIAIAIANFPMQKTKMPKGLRIQYALRDFLSFRAQGTERRYRTCYER